MPEKDVPQTQLSDSKGPQKWSREYFVDKGITGNQDMDRVIQDQIWQHLMKEAELDLSEIEVDVRNGDVTLMGTVTTESMRDHIGNIALNIAGVKNVKNDVHVLKKFRSKETAAE